ncbi:MAG: FG-GAP repeat protein [Planctomycetota bacterium]
MNSCSASSIAAIVPATLLGAVCLLIIPSPAVALEPFNVLTPAVPGRGFGLSVDLAGDFVVIGAPLDTSGNTATVSSAGSVRVKDLTSPTGALIELILRPTDATGFDRFGQSVAIEVRSDATRSDAATILIGAPEHDLGPNAFFGELGAVYAFDLLTGQQTGKLSPPSTIDTNGAHFGTAVAMTDTLAVIGAPRSGLPVIGSQEFGYLPGDAFVYDHRTGAQVSRLTPSVRADNDRFGAAVAIADGVALVGAPEPEGDPGPFIVGPVPAGDGAAYLFDAATGVQSSQLLADDGAAGDLFGSAVAIADGLALVGAPGHRTDGLTLSGAAYLYDVATGAQLAKFTSPAAEAGGRFGASVALGGGFAVVGAYLEDAAGLNSGAAYVFDLATLTLAASITPPDGSSFGLGSPFGFGVGAAIDGDVLVVTSTDSSGPASAAVTAYRLIPEPTAAAIALLAVAAIARRR